MNSSDFEPKRKTRIQRKMRGEETMIPVISEPLQMEYEELIDLGDQGASLDEEIQEVAGIDYGYLSTNFTELAKKMDVVRFEYMIKSAKFWLKLRNQYNVWGWTLGMRDGYEVVKIPFGRNQNTFVR